MRLAGRGKAPTDPDSLLLDPHQGLRPDFRWPVYRAGADTLTFDLGALEAFALRPRRRGDELVRALFVVMFHRRLNEMLWKDDPFWGRTLDEAELLCRQLHEEASQVVVPDEAWFASQRRRHAVLRELLAAAVARRASEAGLVACVERDVPEPQRFRLREQTNNAVWVAAYWGAKRHSYDLADYVDVRLCEELEGAWPVAWRTLPTAPVAARGCYVLALHVAAGDVRDPDAYVPHASTDPARRRRKRSQPEEVAAKATLHARRVTIRDIEFERQGYPWTTEPAMRPGPWHVLRFQYGRLPGAADIAFEIPNPKQVVHSRRAQPALPSAFEIGVPRRMSDTIGRPVEPDTLYLRY